MSRSILSLACALPLLGGAALAGPVTVEITNATHGIYFTPLLVTAHDSGTHLFSVGATASASLRAMAEGGDIAGLLSTSGGEDADTAVDPAGGLLAPGATATATLDTSGTAHTHLSLVGMLLPTNDGFVGLDALEIPDVPGVYTVALNGYDAGTEANDELLNTVDGGVPGTPGIPAAPGDDVGTGGTGMASADANTSVHVHRGVLGDTDSTGGPSDLDSRIHRWLNPVALLRITVE